MDDSWAICKLNVMVRWKVSGEIRGNSESY